MVEGQTQRFKSLHEIWAFHTSVVASTMSTKPVTMDYLLGRERHDELIHVADIQADPTVAWRLQDLGVLNGK